MKSLTLSTIIFLPLMCALTACNRSATDASNSSGGAAPTAQVQTLSTAKSAFESNSNAMQKEIERLITAALKDPDSAQFRNFNVTSDLRHACIEYNGKNVFGGYVGFQREDYRRVDGKLVRDYNSSSKIECTLQSATESLMRQDSMAKGFEDALALVASIRKVDEPTAKTYTSGHEKCNDAYGEYGRHKGHMYFNKAKNNNGQLSPEYIADESRLLKIIRLRCK